jgi:hypothetical protein
MRYDLLTMKEGKGDMTPEEEEELAAVGSPDGSAGSDERKAWFEEWAEAKKNGGGDGGAGDDPMAALQGMPGAGGPGGRPR